MTKSVSWLLFDELDSGRGQFNEYYDRLNSVAPTPETEFINLSLSDREPWDTEQIMHIMEKNEWEKAFVRGMQKAAPQSIEKGSIIKERTEPEIDNTLSSLIVQLNMSEWSHGGLIAIRELLDTRFCLGKNHYMCHPEIRYIIEGGDVLCKIPDSVSVDCNGRYDYLQDIIQSADTPDKIAKKVAEEFDKSTWAVDFVMNTNGDWYCLEMNLNGVRWDDENNRWMNICGYGDKIYLSPEIVHSSVIQSFGQTRN